jgi:hypothetical protein
MAFVVLFCVIGSTIWFLCSGGFGMSRRDGSAANHDASAPDRYAANRVGMTADPETSPWTALDDHQLRRLLDGSPP